MQLKQEYWRFVTAEVQRALAERLGFYWNGAEQDSDLIMSDPGRIAEFINIYKNDKLDDDQKFALMELIVSSFDDLADSETLEKNQLWLECKTILQTEFWLHVKTIHYWSAVEYKSDFFISKYIRPVWEEIKENFY